jgi:hypothetical protein
MERYRDSFLDFIKQEAILKKLVGLTIIALLLGTSIAPAQFTGSTGDGSAGTNSPNSGTGKTDGGTATGK